jgi:hypothetical protein
MCFNIQKQTSTVYLWVFDQTFERFDQLNLLLRESHQLTVAETFYRFDDRLEFFVNRFVLFEIGFLGN